MLEADEVFVDAATLRDPGEHLERTIERPLGRMSSILLLAVIFGGVGYLLFRSFFLQVVSGAQFHAKSEENRFSVRSIFPPRGIIIDQFGEPLVENVPSFGLAFDPSMLNTSGASESDLRSALDAVFTESPALRAEIHENLDAALGSAASDPAILARDIPPELVVGVSSHMDSLPGVQIFESYQRVYADPYAFSHVLGFIGKVSPEDLSVHTGLADQETIGKSGIEGFYDSRLRGSSGKKIVEVDSRGVQTRYKFTQEPVPGAALQVSIDGALQKEIYDVVRSYTQGRRAASVVAVDPRNGAVRGLVSFPGFDANRFGHGLSREEFNAVLGDTLRPLFNRAVSGEFPSGSTIKPLLAAAALQEGIIDPQKKIYDEGFIAIPNPYHPDQQSVFPDWKKHGWVDMYDAIAKSANVYFYMIGGGWRGQEGLGIERIKRYEQAFGLGSVLGIDVPGERPGLVPDPAWKERAEPEDPLWRIGDTYNTSIGQGGTKVTPLQMAMAVSVIANGGTLWKPYILERVQGAEGISTDVHRPIAVREHVIGEDNLLQVVRGMRQTVTAGTARLLSGVPASVAAKTGTAQSTPGKLPHAWVTAFAPSDHPELVLVVMVEYAGEGSTVAVPITNEIMHWYASHRMQNAGVYNHP